jgi:hypothetical protein
MSFVSPLMPIAKDPDLFQRDGVHVWVLSSCFLYAKSFERCLKQQALGCGPIGLDLTYI